VSKKKSPAPTSLELLNAPLIDSHCHLVPRCFGDEIDQVMQRAFDGGLERMVNIGAGYGMEGNLQALEMHKRDAIGIHPHDAGLLTEDPGLYDTLLGLARRPEVVGFGEIGLDFYYEHAPRAAQFEALRRQVEIAREVGKPIIVHDRDAHAEMLETLDECRAWELGVVIHCFSGDRTLAEACLSRGAFLSIPGVVTFKNATQLHEVAATAPLDRLFIETDSPYLAPVPFRGKRNEPAWVNAVAREIAHLRDLDPEEVASATSENARRFFRLPGGA